MYFQAIRTAHTHWNARLWVSPALNSFTAMGGAAAVVPPGGADLGLVPPDLLPAPAAALAHVPGPVPGAGGAPLPDVVPNAPVQGEFETEDEDEEPSENGGNTDDGGPEADFEAMLEH